LRGDDEVAFVLAVRAVEDNDELAGDWKSSVLR
jgi:hypothetical protein